MPRNIIRSEPLPTGTVPLKERILTLAGISDARVASLLDDSLSALQRALTATKTINVAGVPMEIENTAVQVQAAKVLVDFSKSVMDAGSGTTGLSRAIQIVVNTAENGKALVDVTPEVESNGNHT